MQTLLFRIKTTENPHLTDDEVDAYVRISYLQPMDRLRERFPHTLVLSFEPDVTVPGNYELLDAPGGKPGGRSIVA